MAEVNARGGETGYCGLVSASKGRLCEPTVKYVHFRLVNIDGSIVRRMMSL